MAPTGYTQHRFSWLQPAVIRSLFATILLLTAMAPLQAQPATVPILVLNEGNFNRGNASLSAWSPDAAGGASMRNGVFSSVNGLALGDVAQSAVSKGNRLYVVVNNSDLIQILNAETFALIGQIRFNAGSSPREFSPASSGNAQDPAADLALVTHLYDNAVSLVDLSTNQIQPERIKVGLNPDKLLSHGGKWYVANWGFGSDSTIMVVSKDPEASSNVPSSYRITDTLYTDRGPREMVIDSNKRLWVLCEGYTAYDESFNVIEEQSRPGGLLAFDLETGERLLRIELAAAGEDLVYDPALERLYFLSEGVRVFDLQALTLRDEPLVEGSFYSLGISVDGGILLSDAADYVSAGEVFLYSPQGTLLREARAGIIPGHFVRVPTEGAFTSSESVSSPPHLPGVIRLGEAYPNPFNPQASLPLWLGADTRVTVSVYDMMGRKIQRLYEGPMSRGWHTLRIDAESWPAGTYLVRLSGGGQGLSTRITLVK